MVRHGVKSAGRPQERSAPQGLKPVDIGNWQPVKLKRADRLSFYFCSAYAFHDPRTKQLVQSNDMAGVGGC